MKKSFCFLAVLALSILAGFGSSTSAQNTCYATGDFNGDGMVFGVADLVAGFRMLGCGIPPPESLYRADLNGDCRVDSADVRILEDYFIYGRNAIRNPYPVPTCCNPSLGTFILGDVNADGEGTAADAVLELACVFSGGEGCRLFFADLNFDRELTAVDAVQALNFVYLGTAPSGCP